MENFLVNTRDGITRMKDDEDPNDEDDDGILWVQMSWIQPQIAPDPTYNPWDIFGDGRTPAPDIFLPIKNSPPKKAVVFSNEPTDIGEVLDVLPDFSRDVSGPGSGSWIRWANLGKLGTPWPSMKGCFWMVC